jgi:hypothetical protein
MAGYYQIPSEQSPFMIILMKTPACSGTCLWITVPGGDMIRQRLRLANLRDKLMLQAGNISEKDVRAIEIDAVVEPDSMITVLPPGLVESLGLEQRGEFAGALSLEIFDREMHTDCRVGPAGSEPTIGHIVMARLDLVIDPTGTALAPRSPILTLKMKALMRERPSIAATAI